MEVLSMASVGCHGDILLRDCIDADAERAALAAIKAKLKPHASKLVHAADAGREQLAAAENAVAIAAAELSVARAKQAAATSGNDARAVVAANKAVADAELKLADSHELHRAARQIADRQRQTAIGEAEGKNGPTIERMRKLVDGDEAAAREELQKAIGPIVARWLAAAKARNVFLTTSDAGIIANFANVE